jgi:hypothetical protein
MFYATEQFNTVYSICNTFFVNIKKSTAEATKRAAAAPRAEMRS